MTLGAGPADLAPTPAERAAWENRGWFVREGLLPPAEVDALRAEALALCRGERGPFIDWTPPRPGEPDADVLARYLALHFPHKLSPPVRALLADPRLVAPVAGLLGPNVKCMQSMLFLRAAGAPGQAWHQDEYYIPTRDRSLTAAWVALDPATVETGCLWALPGSHAQGVLWPHAPHDDPRFDVVPGATGFPGDDAAAVPIEVGPGDAVFFHGYLLHRSLPNRRSGAFRRALAFHYMRAESLLPWMGAERETHHPGAADYRDVVLVSGVDPYAFKGYVDRSRPHARPPRPPTTLGGT